MEEGGGRDFLAATQCIRAAEGKSRGGYVMKREGKGDYEWVRESQCRRGSTRSEGGLREERVRGEF